MGMLDQAPEDEGASSEPEPAANEPDASASEATTVATEPEQRQHVPINTRRGAARAERDALASEFKAFKETFSKREDETRAELAKRDQEIARLRGGFDALQPLIQQRQQPAEPAGPTPEELTSRAKQALDAGRFDEYQGLILQAAEGRAHARTMKELEGRGIFKQQQEQGPPQHPAMQAIRGQHWAVTAHPMGEQLARAKDMELEALGYQNGPERWKKAFEMAEATIRGASATTPRQYSQQSAGALAGVPGGRSAAAAAARGPGVELSDLEREWARRADMKYEEYAEEIAKAHPERIIK